MERKVIGFIVALMLGLYLLTPQAMGQDYPRREIELIAAFAPGSNTDNFARLAAKHAE
jgi:tripartite-type tricarboxylate transporter receptor subunit TctC